jgi:hypothetical protein
VCLLIGLRAEKYNKGREDMKMYAVTAVYTPAPKDGWQSTGQQLPTFYLNPDVQGIVSNVHAEKIVMDMFQPMLKEGDTLHSKAILVDL